MHLEVNYPLARLNDKILRWLLAQTERDDRLQVSPLARELNTAFQNEQIRRLRVAAGTDPKPVTLALPVMTYEQACEGFVELTEDSGELVRGIATVESSEPELAATVREGISFLESTALALKSYAEMIRSTGAEPPN